MKKPTEKTEQNVSRETVSEKKASVLVFDDGYVIVALSIDGKPEYSKKSLKIGDRVKNAIKAMAKEGYKIEVSNITQPEIPFYTEGTNS